MIPTFLAEVRGHVGVTGQAQALLRRLVERFVTLAALVLDAGVFHRDLTGHDQRFDP